MTEGTTVTGPKILHTTPVAEVAPLSPIIPRETETSVMETTDGDGREALMTTAKDQTAPTATPTPTQNVVTAPAPLPPKTENENETEKETEAVPAIATENAATPVPIPALDLVPTPLVPPNANVPPHTPMAATKTADQNVKTT